MAGGDGAGCVPGVELCAKGAESGVKINRLRDVSQAARLPFFFFSLSLFSFLCLKNGTALVPSLFGVAELGWTAEGIGGGLEEKGLRRCFRSS